VQCSSGPNRLPGLWPDGGPVAGTLAANYHFLRPSCECTTHRQGLPDLRCVYATRSAASECRLFAPLVPFALVGPCPAAVEAAGRVVADSPTCGVEATGLPAGGRALRAAAARGPSPRLPLAASSDLYVQRPADWVGSQVAASRFRWPSPCRGLGKGPCGALRTYPPLPSCRGADRAMKQLRLLAGWFCARPWRRAAWWGASLAGAVALLLGICAGGGAVWQTQRWRVRCARVSRAAR